jgi:hypothetical protein
MDYVNPQFHSLVTDGDTEQVLFLSEVSEPDGISNYWGYWLGNFYLSTDGDMTSDGATFVDDMSQTPGYRVGLVPSRTMSVSLMNVDGYLNGHNFGWMSAHIGVRYDSSSITLNSGELTRYVDTLHTYSFRETGFYVDNVQKLAYPCCGGWCTNAIYGVYYDTQANEYKVFEYEWMDDFFETLDYESTYNRQLTEASIEKFRNGRFFASDVHYPIGQNDSYYAMLHDTRGGETTSYYITDVGTFFVNRPSKTMRKVIDIHEAFDAMRLLDVDATPVLQTSSATNAKTLLEDIIDYCGFQIQYSDGLVQTDPQDRLTAISVNIAELSKNAYTCRRLIALMLEAVGCNARARTTTITSLPNGIFIYSPIQEGTGLWGVTADHIAANGLETEEYTTEAFDCVRVKTMDNSVEVYPTSGGNLVYEINANPFVPHATSALLGYIADIPTYVPMSVEAIEADPSFQIGDLTFIYPDPDDQTVVYRIPITSQTVRFRGKTFATIEACGTDNDIGYVTDNYTDTNARVFKPISPSQIVGTLTNDINNTNITTANIAISGHNSKIGTILESAPSANVSVSAGLTTGTAVCSINLPVGTWIIAGYVRWSATAGRKIVTLSATSGVVSSTTFRSDLYTEDSTVSTMEVMAIRAIAGSETFYLNAASSVSATVDKTYSKIHAIRIL